MDARTAQRFAKGRRRKGGPWAIAPCKDRSGLYTVGVRRGLGAVSPMAEYLDQDHAFSIAAFDPLAVLAPADDIEALEQGPVGKMIDDSPSRVST